MYNKLSYESLSNLLEPVAKPVGIATLLIIAGGCASMGTVRSLEQELKDTKQTFSDYREKVDRRLQQVETRPIIEKDIKVHEHTNPVEFGMLLGIVLNKYQNQSSRGVAERNANAITLQPTNDRNVYEALVLYTENKGEGYQFGADVVYPDARIGSPISRFKINKDELPEIIKQWLISRPKIIER